MGGETAEKLLEDLIGIPSVNGADGTRPVAGYLRDVFAAQGIAARIQPVDGERVNLVAELGDPDSPAVTLWCGHMDTVPCGDRALWATDPTRPVRQGGRLYGRGASDMKSGLAAMVYALTHAEGRVPAGRLVFLATCDEEAGGAGARAFCRSFPMERVKNILIGEPTLCTAGIAQKSCLWLRITVHGRASHGALPWQGVNAVEMGFRAAEQFRAGLSARRHPLLGLSTVQITRITGGIAPNVTPDRCEMWWDVRLVPGLSAEGAVGDLRRIFSALAQGAPGLSCEISVENERPAVETAPDAPFTGRLLAAMEKNNVIKRFSGSHYFTDGSILTAAAPGAACLLFGPGDPELCHKADESVSLEELTRAVCVLQDMIGSSVFGRRA